MRSEAVEDYLKAIYELQEEGGRAKTSLLAGKLGLTPGSVSDMVQRLAGDPHRLVEYRHHQGVILTPEGRRSALQVIRRHRLLETFLHRILGYSWEEIHAEADRLEHHISERMTEAIARVLDQPRFDPHGDPIPAADGRIPEHDWTVLSRVAPGRRVAVRRVRNRDEQVLGYLGRMGIGVGTEIQVVERAPLEGPIQLRLDPDSKNTPMTMDQSLANTVFVEILR